MFKFFKHRSSNLETFTKTETPLLEEMKKYDERRKSNEPISFDDFRYMLKIHLEFPFWYHEKMYEIVWSERGLEFYRNQTENYDSKEYEIYPSEDLFLKNAYIEGKLVANIVDDLTF